MKMRGKKKEPTLAEPPDLLEETFRKYDVDGNGHLDEAEMFSAMKDIMGEKFVTNAMVVKVMKEIDADGSGVVELDEFYDLFEKCDELVESGWLEKSVAEQQAAVDAAAVGATAPPPGSTFTAAAAGNGATDAAASAELIALMKELKDQQENEITALRNEVTELRKELGGLKKATSGLMEKKAKKSEKAEEQEIEEAQDLS